MSLRQASSRFGCGCVEFLPSEKQGMARVVCDELARQAYDSSTDVFVKRLIQLRELSEDWSQIDGIKGICSLLLIPCMKCLVCRPEYCNVVLVQISVGWKFLIDC